MTDAFSASQFTPGTDFGASQFDATQTDRNLRQISAVEKTWHLPALPPGVKLDLATVPGVNEDGLSAFLTGLDSDLAPEEVVEEYDPLALPSSLSTDPIKRTGLQQAQMVLAGISGSPAPRATTADAVKLLKQRAVREGYLEEGYPVDSTWTPELNGIRGEMAFDDYNERMRGDRPGASSMSGVMKLLNDFTSPSGLLAAATELDLFWDFGAVKDEFSSWGDKWQQVGESKNPLDFAGNLIDALTGPIDDIVIPVVNVGLLFVGVGAVANTARIGWMGRNAVAGGRLLEGLYSTTRSVRNIEELGRASWTAQKLAASSSQVASSLGRGMATWRNLGAVKRSKSIIQQGMRLGFAHEVEDRMGTFKGGVSLGDIAPGVRDAATSVENFGLAPAALPIEMLIAPYNIWTPGTFLRAGGEGLNLLNRVGSGAAAALGSAPGRAAVGGLVGVTAGTVAGDDTEDVVRGGLLGLGIGAALPLAGRALESPLGRTAVGGAVGAAAGSVLGDDPDDAALGALAGAGLIGASQFSRKWMRGGTLDRAIAGAGTALSHSSFRPLADDQRVAFSFHRGMRRILEGDPDRLANWDQHVKNFGVTKALSVMQGADEETAAATIGYTLASAAIDHTARLQASVGGSAWRDRFHIARNKLINQLRHFDLSNPSERTLDEIAWSAAFAEKGTMPGVRKRYRQLRRTIDSEPGVALELAAAHNETASQTVRQLMSADNMPDPFSTEGQNLIGDFGKQADPARASILETYMPQIADTFGDFPKFAASTASVRELNGLGLLEGATFAAARNRKGNLVVPVKVDLGPQPVGASIPDANRAFTDILFDGRVNADKARRFGRFTPLARSSEGGRFTVMRSTTMAKQQWIELGERVADVVDANKNLTALKAEPWRQFLDATGLDVATTPLREIVRASNLKSKKALRYVLDYARRHGLSLDQVDQEVTNAAEAMALDTNLWRGAGLDVDVLDETGRQLYGVAALRRRLKQVDEQAKYSAAEVDVDQLERYVRESVGEADGDQIKALAEGLKKDDYKMVYGVEFLMPDDLAHGPVFRDVTRRHLNAATLGNFFRGRTPVEAKLFEERRQRLALATELSKLGDDVHPESEAVTRALDDLRTHVLDPYLHQTEGLLQDIHNQNFLERKMNAAKSSFTPLRLDDLQQKKSKILEALKGRGYTEPEALAVWRAVARFRNTEFKDMGLYALEAKLRSSNQVAWALKTLSGAKHGTGLMARGKGKRALGAAFGASMGSTAAGEDATFEERLGAIVLGGAAGTAAASLLPAAAGRMGLDALASRADNWRFGYLADQYARMRDSLRFTLSPFFDISRYTEGLMLAQTASPTRLPDGSRLALPLDMSPSGFRRRLRKSLSTDAAGARVKYDEVLREFNAASRRDYDPDALDATGRWFRQIGIMGFSPTDWMGTAFGELRRRGIEPEQAYNAARSMYTYGTTGRSAAELSVNFVFFPFSFQKKALTHLAKWANDDLSRSLMIHDALKTYEILDEEYDLDRVWREHFPALQQLQKLNLFAYGLSPGRFGGINSQLLESTGKVAWNMFVPAGMQIKDAGAGKELQDVVRSLTPALNDINWMTQNLKEQGHVLFSDSHVTTAAETREGYQEWNSFRREFGAELEEQGYKWGDLNEPWMSDVKAYYEGKRAELGRRFPAWQASRVESVQEINALNMEKQFRLDRVTAANAGGEPTTLDDMQFAEFETFLESQKADLELLGFGRDFENAPPEVADIVLSKSVENSRENPGWRAVWDKFYRREHGPIDVALLGGV